MQTSEMEIAIVLGLSAAEAALTWRNSASCYDIKENILVVAIVKAILRFREIQRQVLLAQVGVRPDIVVFFGRITLLSPSGARGEVWLALFEERARTFFDIAGTHA